MISKGRLKQIRQTQVMQSPQKIDESTKAVSYRQTHTQITQIELKKRMASEQISQNELFTQAVAKAARVAIQTMAMASTPRQDNAGLKRSGSTMKQPTFNWNAKDKYEEL